jgi:hypothetical protein
MVGHGFGGQHDLASMIWNARRPAGKLAVGHLCVESSGAGYRGL